jgi:hypothetical protein
MKPFIEKAVRHGEFIRWADSQSAVEFPALNFLRVELERMQTGMSDYIIRVSTPKYASIVSNTVLSIRGDRSLTKFDAVRRLAEVIRSEMSKRGDKTFGWDSLDVDHLADLIATQLKFFSVNQNVSSLKFATEALL